MRVQTPTLGRFNKLVYFLKTDPLKEKHLTLNPFFTFKSVSWGLDQRFSNWGLKLWFGGPPIIIRSCLFLFLINGNVEQFTSKTH